MSDTRQTIDRNAAIEKLLSDARIAETASGIAKEQFDVLRSKELLAKSRRLMADAETMDPGHECAAWKIER